jgi:hypothetical protein
MMCSVILCAETENPRENRFHGVTRKYRIGSRLFLRSSFACTHFEAFFAKYTAALFGSLSELLSHSAGGCSQSRPPRQMILLKTGFRSGGL